MKKRVLFFGVMALLVSAALCGCSGGKSTEASKPVKNSSEEAPAGSAAVSGMTGTAEAAEPAHGGSAAVSQRTSLIRLGASICLINSLDLV